MNEAKDETIRMEELEQVGKEVEKTEEVFCVHCLRVSF